MASTAHGWKPFAVLACALVASSSCGYADSGHAAWTLPVPASATIVEYEAVPMEERSGRVALIEDLVLVGPEDDQNYKFYAPEDLAVDSAGRMYVADSGNARIQVFDSEGGYIRTLGRPGQGPGEFTLLAGVAIVGEKVVGYDFSGRRISVWDTAGKYLADHRLTGPLYERIDSVSDEQFVARLADGAEDGTHDVIAGFSATAANLTRYVDIPLSVAPVMSNRVTMRVLFPETSFAANAAGGVYVTDRREYQVLAFDVSGDLRWALRVDADRGIVDDAVKHATVALLRNAVPNLDPTGAEWPDALPALSHVSTDGRGRLYVFPYYWPAASWGSYGPMKEGTELVPVDVYSSAGERELSAMMKRWKWRAALGDLVYGFRQDGSGETQVVRYRLAF